MFFAFRAAFLIAALAAPVLAAAQPASLRPPGETGPISPAEDVWGRVATLLRDPTTPLTRKTVEKALGVRLKLDPAVGNGSNVFRLPKPAKWPLLLSLVENDEGTTRLGATWDDTDKRYSFGYPGPYCVLKSEFESLLREYRWTTDISLQARLNSIAMDAPVLGAVWRRVGTRLDLSAAVQPDCLSSFNLFRTVQGYKK